MKKFIKFQLDRSDFLWREESFDVGSRIIRTIFHLSCTSAYSLWSQALTRFAHRRSSARLELVVEPFFRSFKSLLSI